jgi:hypothetical protein
MSERLENGWKLVKEVYKYKDLIKFDSIFVTNESPVDKENSI